MLYKSHLLTAFFVFIEWAVYAQTSPKVYRNPNDTTQNFYQVYIPEGTPKGVLFIAYENFRQPHLATEQGLLLVSSTPSTDYLATMFNETIFVTLDQTLAEICQKYQVPKNKIILGGLSAAGTLAVRYAQYCVQNKSTFDIHPAAIFAVDPPLDYERFWTEAQRSVDRNFHSIAVGEANWVMARMSKEFGGTPDEVLTRYRTASPYNYHSKNGGQTALLKEMPLRLYTEPDVHWWLENRRKDYYSMNSIDCAAMVNDLWLLGNKRAELITTTGKGYQNGNRHPHAWTIVDEKELVEWSLKQLQE